MESVNKKKKKSVRASVGLVIDKKFHELTEEEILMKVVELNQKIMRLLYATLLIHIVIFILFLIETMGVIISNEPISIKSGLLVGVSVLVVLSKNYFHKKWRFIKQKLVPVPDSLARDVMADSPQKVIDYVNKARKIRQLRNFDLEIINLLLLEYLIDENGGTVEE